MGARIEADAVVVGGGPSGLSAAEVIARAGFNVVVLEANPELGSPTRTTGGSVIADMRALGIPEHLYHPLLRGRFASAHNSVSFEYQTPVACVIDVRGVFQHLGERAVDAGARLRLSTAVSEPIVEDGQVRGVRALVERKSGLEVRANIVIDASGYTATVARKAGIHPGFRRFGVGAEYDMHAPHYDQDEVMAIVGTAVAPAGYAWAAPWGRKRVRVGVAIIHGDSSADPKEYLDAFVKDARLYGVDLRGAQPIEYHSGLIPSDGLAPRLVGNGVMAVGDAAGQASALLGEGIRWVMRGGRMAGEVAAQALAAGDLSARYLSRYERQWKARYGTNLRIAHRVNERLASLNDAGWDKAIDSLKLLSAEQFASLMASNFVGGLPRLLLSSDPRQMKRGAQFAVESLFGVALRRG